jgi:hypothetical protein
MTMNKLNRRKFNQLMMASTAVAAIGVPIEPAVAEEAEEKPKLLGFRVRPLTTTNKVDSKDEEGGSDTEIVFQAINPETGQIEPEEERVLRSTPLVLQRGERIAGFAALSSASLLFSKTQGVPGAPEVVSHLIVVNKSSQTLTVTGLGDNNTVETLLITDDGSILCVVSLNSGVPPFSLATIDAETGTACLLEDFHFPSDARFSNLAQCGNGLIYGTSIGTEGSIRLVQIDIPNQQIIDLPFLHFEEQMVPDDLKSLTFSSSGQLYALADLKERGKNLLLTIDIDTGALHLVNEIDTEKITFSRA